MRTNILRWTKTIGSAYGALFLCVSASILTSSNAMAQLKSTDIFEERPQTSGFDAETRIDAIKRERIEAQRQGVDAQRKNFESEMSRSCECVLLDTCRPPLVLTYRPANPYDYKRSPRKYEQWNKKLRAAEEARKHSVSTQAERDSQRRRRESEAKRRKLCLEWKERGANEESEMFRQKIRALNNQVQQEAAVEARLATERRERYAGQLMQKYANEQRGKDNVQVQLKRQRDAENERRRLQNFKSQQETVARLERQKAACRAEVAKYGSPDSCGCQGLLNWRSGGSCSK